MNEIGHQKQSQRSHRASQCREHANREALNWNRSCLFAWCRRLERQSTAQLHLVPKITSAQCFVNHACCAVFYQFTQLACFFAAARSYGNFFALFRPRSCPQLLFKSHYPSLIRTRNKRKSRKNIINRLAPMFGCVSCFAAAQHMFGNDLCAIGNSSASVVRFFLSAISLHFVTCRDDKKNSDGWHWHMIWTRSECLIERATRKLCAANAHAQ